MSRSPRVTGSFDMADVFLFGNDSQYQQMIEGLSRGAGDVTQQVELEQHQQTESQVAMEEREFESEDPNSSSTVSPSVLTDHDCTALRPAALPSPVPSSPDPVVRSSPTPTSGSPLSRSPSADPVNASRSSSVHASPARRSSPVLLTDAQIDVLCGMSPISPPKRKRRDPIAKRRSESDYVYSSSESLQWRQAGHEATASWSLQPVDDCQLPQTREPQLQSSAAEEHYWSLDTVQYVEQNPSCGRTVTIANEHSAS